MNAPDLRIEWMRLDDLVPAGRNSRRHALDDLNAAVDSLGFTTELKVDEASGRLVWGHGRLALLRRKRDAGDPLPDGIREDADGEWLAPVVRGWSSRDELHADAVREADNRQHERGSYDDATSLDILGDIAADAPDYLAGIGVTSDELDRLAEEAGGADVTVLLPGDLGDDDVRDAGRPVESRDDEQWQDGDDPDEGSTREEDGPGPLDVEPAWRTLHPWRAIYHQGGERGAQKVADWLRPHVRDVAVHADSLGRWYVWGREGELIVREGEWATRDGQTGRIETWETSAFQERFVAANEPARRVMRDAKPVPGSNAEVLGRTAGVNAADILRHGSGVLTAENARVALAGHTDAHE